MQIQRIKHTSDYQIKWSRAISTLRNYEVDSVDFLSISGDAPKDFITDSEYRDGHRSRRQRVESYIAKIGSKYYPNESITEHLATRIGQVFGLSIAESKLRIIDGQVRFMSKYFLDRQTEQLTHGAEIFELCLGKENYAELRTSKTESEYLTFQMTSEAIKEAFPGFFEKITDGFVEMLAFDALIGHNDRHPYNWGVIVPIRKSKQPRFSPVFDTARALFWNIPETRVKRMLSDSGAVESYIQGCRPPIGWDREEGVDFFRLIGLIWQAFPRYRQLIEKFFDAATLRETAKTLGKEFGLLMSTERRELIIKCLKRRQQLLKEACEM